MEIYTNAHLLKIDDPLNDFNKRIALGCGVGLTESDFSDFVRYAERIYRIAHAANEENCSLYIDAEQTFINPNIDSVTQ